VKGIVLRAVVVENEVFWQIVKDLMSLKIDRVMINVIPKDAIQNRDKVIYYLVFLK
jgi:hypothetical protein